MTQEDMLARYSILRELGRGATGAVYAARDRQTGRVVALKRLDAASSSKGGASSAERLLKQALAARLLKHRNIAEVHDAGEIGGTVYVAMEMLEGQNLRSMLDAGPLAISRAIQLAHDIASALAHAHLQGVVHGALKPSNVIVLPSGAAKITDFGIGHLAGCPGCMSPEQARGEPVDHRSDIFSFGVLFYEMLARRAPFEGGSPKEIIESVLHARPPLPSELNPHVPRALDEVVLSMLAVQPAARMPGFPVLLRELQSLEEGLGLGSGEAIVPPAKPEAKVRTPEPKPLHDEPGRGDRISDHEAFDYHRAMAMMERESRRERSSGWRPAIFAVLAVLGIGLGGFMYYSADPAKLRNEVSRIRETLATALATSRSTTPAPVAGATREEVLPSADPMLPKPLAEEPVALAQREPLAEETEEPANPSGAPQASLPRAAGDDSSAQSESVVAGAAEKPTERGIASTPVQEAPAEASGASHPAAPPPVAEASEEPASAPIPAAAASEQPASAAAARAPKLLRATQPAAKVREPQARGTARLILAVSPRGDIYIDGKHHGTTPPLTSFDLEPGLHRIEVRSGSRTPYLTYMTVQAGDVRRIRHDFDTSRAVFPRRSALSQNR